MVSFNKIFNCKSNLKLEAPIGYMGGKRRLLPALWNNLPKDFDTYDLYIEPFVGMGSMFLSVLSKYPDKTYFINDIDNAIINIYLAIKNDVKSVIAFGKDVIDAMKVSADKNEYFLSKRERNIINS